MVKLPRELPMIHFQVSAHFILSVTHFAPFFFLIQLHFAQSPQLFLILCDELDCSSPGSSVHGILQTRILECVVIPSSRGSSQPRGQNWQSRFLGVLHCRPVLHH